jgi:hypothetical protein
MARERSISIAGEKEGAEVPMGKFGMAVLIAFLVFRVVTILLVLLKVI